MPADKRLIAKNAIFLYVRMAFAMVVSLFTTRVVLQVLGVDGFGIFSIVGGLIVLFTFVNDTMVGSTQRFLNFELGRGNHEGFTKCFSASFRVQVIFSLIIIILAETIGLYYLDHYVKLPPGRLYAARWIYQLAILTTVIRILRMPFTAAVVAHERMNVFAITGVVNVCLKLAIVYALLILPGDRLITYALLSTAISVSMTTFYVFYCHTHFAYCRIQRTCDNDVLRKMLGFSAWNLLGSLSRLATFQGVDLLLNYFHGVFVNAALALSNQVYGAAMSFNSSFQTAFKPQITKTYASGELNEMHRLIIDTTRYSFFLVIVGALPLFFQCGNLLHLWLGQVPRYTLEFCNIMILLCVADTIAAPLWMSAQATGDVKEYFIAVSGILFLNFPITWVCFAMDLSPVWAIIVRLLVCCSALVYRLYFLRRKIGLSLRAYLRLAVKPCLYVLLPATLVSAVVNLLPWHTVIVTAVLFVITVSSILLLGLSQHERKQLQTAVASRLGR